MAIPDCCYIVWFVMNYLYNKDRYLSTTNYGGLWLFSDFRVILPKPLVSITFHCCHLYKNNELMTECDVSSSYKCSKNFSGDKPIKFTTFR